MRIITRPIIGALRSMAASSSKILARSAFFGINNAPIGRTRREQLRGAVLADNKRARVPLANRPGIPGIIRTRISIALQMWMMRSKNLARHTILGMAQSRFSLVRNTLFFVLRYAPLSPDRQKQVYDAIIEEAPAAYRQSLRKRFFNPSDMLKFLKDGTLKGTANGFPVHWHELAKGQPQNSSLPVLTQKAFSESNGPVTILLENGAGLERLLDWPALKGRELNVYAFNNREQEVRALETDNTINLKSLREQFPDVSEEAQDMHLFCRRLAQEIVEKLTNALGPSAKTIRDAQNVYMQPLEDDLSWRLSLLECYRVAAEKGSAAGPVIIMSSGSTVFPAALDLVAQNLPSEKLYVAIDTSSTNKERMFWQKVNVHLRRDNNNTHQKPSHAQSLIDHFTTRMDSANRLGVEMAKRIKSPMSDDKPPLIVLFHPSNAAYVETVDLLLRTCVQKNRTGIALACAPTQPLDPSHPAFKDGLFISATTSFTHSFLDGGLSERAHEELSAIVAPAFTEHAYRGIDVTHIVSDRLRDFIQRKVFIATCLRAHICSLVQMNNIPVVMTTPGRHWIVRCMADALIAQKMAKVVDMQALNVFAHPKYLPPVCDYAAVIDDTAASVHADGLGMESSKIYVTGTPRNDRQIADILALDRTALCEKLDLDKSCTKRVLFASQLQPWERIAEPLVELAKLTRKNSDIEVVIKLHPREIDGRYAAYTTLIAEHAAPERMIVLADCTATEAIAVSDACVTIYSNMGREAAIAGRPVIVSHPGGWVPPMRLDVEGLALLATSPADISKKIINAFKPTKGCKTENKYLKRNAHLTGGGSAERILDLVDQATLEQGEYDSTDRILSSEAAIVAGRVVVIAENSNALMSCTHVVPRAEAVDIFVPSLVAGIATYPETRFHTNEYEASQEALTRQATERAQILAQNLSAHICTLLQPEKLGARLATQQDAMTLWFRSKLISTFRNAALFKAAMESGADQVILLGQSASFFSNMLQQIADSSAPNICVVEADNSMSELIALQLEGDVDPKSHMAGFCRFVTREELGQVRPGALAKALADGAGTSNNAPQNPPKPEHIAALENWLQKLSNINAPLPKKPGVVVTTAWNLKTVPPSLLPVLRELESDKSLVAMNFQKSGFDIMQQQISQAATTRDIWNIQASDLEAILPTKNRRANKAMARHLVEQLGGHEIFAEHDPFVVAEALELVVIFTQVIAWQMIGWDHFCRQILKPKGSVSLACPGRQWHAQIAHTVAEDLDRQSITLQNAYMTASYTYAKPTGRVITAIDTWQRDVFINSFGIDASRIIVTGTPRFDYLAEMKAKEETHQVQTDTDNSKLFLFAAQPGYDDITRTFIETLCTKRGHALGLDTIIKMHPRSNEAEAGEWRRLIEAKGGRRISVVTDAPLEDLLFEAALVATAFSNVGMEAAVLSKPLIVTRFKHNNLPLKLDELGVGIGVATPAKLLGALEQIHSDKKFAIQHRKSQDAYFEDNPVFRSGTSARIIADLID